MHDAPASVNRKVTFVLPHTLPERSHVTVEWDQDVDDGTYDKFVDLMKREGYKMQDQPSKTTVRLKGETFSRRQVEDMLQEAGVEVVGDIEERVEQLEREMEVIRGNRQA